jgi:hypothetical protein
MPEIFDILDAALQRGMNMKKDHIRFQSYNPPPNDMYRIILAAVANLHEAVMARLDEIEGKIGARAVQAPAIGTDKEPSSGPPANELPPPDIGRANKPCEACGEMMLNVHPATKYCPKCKEARK